MPDNSSDLVVPASSTEPQVLSFLTALDGEAESARKKYDKDWEENIRQVRGEQWRLRRNPYFLANIIKNQVRKKTAFLTETKAQIQVRSTKSELTQASLILYNAAKSLLDRSHTNDQLNKVSQYGMTLGSAFLYSTYNPLEDDIDIVFIDPRRVWLDPFVTSASEVDKAQYVRIDTVLPLSEIRTRFPGRGLLVKPGDQFSAYSDSPNRTRMSLTASVLQAMPRIYRPGASAKPGPIQRAEIREYWIKDPQMGVGGESLYPGGRHIIRSGDIILLDEANPYWDGKFPIDMFEWDSDFNNPWGSPDVPDLRRLQEAINRMGDAWIKNTILGSNFKIIADLDALDPDQWDKLDNEAGIIIRKKPQRELRYEQPVPDQGTMPQAIDGLIKLCDLLTGVGESSRSPAQGAAALEGLQMARQVLTRAVARRMESLLERVGQKLISRIFQYYTSDRILMQQGPSRDWVAYTFQRQKLLEDDKGNVRKSEDREQMYRDFKFLVTPGSSLASSRVQRTMAMLQMRSATGFAPSVRRILNEADIGDPDEIIREGLEEMKHLPAPPVPKGRGGRA